MMKPTTADIAITIAKVRAGDWIDPSKMPLVEVACSGIFTANG
jgi:hypothetical protein